MENIGYIKKEKLQLDFGLNTIESIPANIEFGKREDVENRDDVIQIVCAGTIITNSGKVLAINKSIKKVSATSPERNKTSLYIGGHLDDLDMKNDLVELLKCAMKRDF